MSGIPQTTVHVNVPTKSVGVAFLLSFFFGPLGMLYSTVMGGVIMIIVSGIVAVLTLGFGLLITQPICVIWAIVAANSHNKQVMASMAGSVQM